jgi:hypothetical protein
MDTKQVLTISAYVVVGVGVVVLLSKTKVLPIIPEKYLPDWSIPNLYPTALDTRLYDEPPASQDPKPADLSLADACLINSQADYNVWTSINKWGMLAPPNDSVMTNTLISGAKADAGCFARNT